MQVTYASTGVLHWCTVPCHQRLPQVIIPETPLLRPIIGVWTLPDPPRLWEGKKCGNAKNILIHLSDLH